MDGFSFSGQTTAQIFVIGLVIVGIVAALVVLLGRRKNITFGRHGFTLSDSDKLNNDSYVIDAITGAIDRVDMDVRRKMYDETISMPLPDNIINFCEGLSHSDEFKYIFGDMILEKLRRPLLAAISFNHICREVSIMGRDAYFLSKERQVITLTSTLDKLISKNILQSGVALFLQAWLVMVIRYSLGACDEKLDIYKKYISRKDISEDCRQAIQRRIAKNENYYQLMDRRSGIRDDSEKILS
jgi:hypothetical protein